MATHSSVLAWRIPGTGEPGGLPSMALARYSVSREVPRSLLKSEKLLGTLDATPKVSRHEQLERPAGFPSSDKTRPDSPVPALQGPCGRSFKWRGTLTLLPQSVIRSSSIAPVPVKSREAPLNSTVSLTSHRHSEKLLEATGKRRGDRKSVV